MDSERDVQEARIAALFRDAAADAALALDSAEAVRALARQTGATP